MSAAQMLGATLEQWNWFSVVLGLAANVLPVVPDPTAQASPNSKVKAWGKVPSAYDAQGRAYGLKGWQERVITPDMVTQWSTDPRLSMCLRMGPKSGVYAIDVDVTDPALAERIAAAIEAKLGVKLPRRDRSDSSKFMLLLRCAASMRKRIITVRAQPPQRVEMLGEGQQAVMAGCHPSGAPYEWRDGMPYEIPTLSLEQVEAAWSALTQEFATAADARTTDRSEYDGQTEALTSIDEPTRKSLRDALAFPAMLQEAASNDFWSKCGYALKSLGDTGYELWCAFSAAAPGYTAGAPEDWWNAHAYQAPRSDYRHILKLARSLGWHPAVDVESFPVEIQPEERSEHKDQSASRLPKVMVNDKGKPLSNAANAERVIRSILHGKLTFDEFLDRPMIYWPEESTARPFRDEDTTRLQIDLQRLGMVSVSATAVRDAVDLIGRANPSNVLVERLSKLEWDRIRRLSLLLPRGFGTPTTRYYIRAGRNMLLAMVARAMNPGCQVDEALVLEGPQGVFKSSALRIIGGEFFKELTANPNSKDFEVQLRAVWLGEFAELNALRRTDDIARLKQFITCTVDHYRPPYGREPRDFKRRVVLCGTTNDEAWAHDPTGNRRFIPITVGKIDLEWLRQNRDQLFAEAVALYKAGRKWWIYPRKETLEIQDARRPEDPWTERVRTYLKGRDEVQDLSEILTCALDLSTDRQTHANLTRLGVVLRMLGCKRQNQRRIDGVRRRPWSVPADLAKGEKVICGFGPVPTTSNDNGDLI
jgi:hypothetical protein